jgi:hypothetical protein
VLALDHLQVRDLTNDGHRGAGYLPPPGAPPIPAACVLCRRARPDRGRLLGLRACGS